MHYSIVNFLLLGNRRLSSFFYSKGSCLKKKRKKTLKNESTYHVRCSWKINRKITLTNKNRKIRQVLPFFFFATTVNSRFFFLCLQISFFQFHHFHEWCHVVYDRTAKNVVRPNPNGSAISTEGSAEPFGRTSPEFLVFMVQN